MSYAEKVEYAKEKLGKNRKEFASFLGTSEEFVENIEICKDSSRKFDHKKETEIIEVAGLPPNYFDDDIDTKAVQLSDETLFYRLFPSAKEKITYREALELINMITKWKSFQ